MQLYAFKYKKVIDSCFDKVYTVEEDCIGRKSPRNIREYRGGGLLLKNPPPIALDIGIKSNPCWSLRGFMQIYFPIYIAGIKSREKKLR